MPSSGHVGIKPHSQEKELSMRLFSLLLSVGRLQHEVPPRRWVSTALHSCGKRMQPRTGPGLRAASNTADNGDAANPLNNVLVVGGGLAGLSTAVALRNIAGVTNIRVVEQQPSHYFYDDTAGAAAQLSPNGLRALEVIGGRDFLQTVLASGHATTQNACIMPDNNVVVIPDVAAGLSTTRDLPQMLIRWGVLRSLLVDLLPTNTVETGVSDEIAGYAVDNGMTLLNCENAAMLGTDQSSPSLVIAADGITSTLSALVHANTRAFGSPAERQAAQRANLSSNERVNIKAVVPQSISYDTLPSQTDKVDDGTAISWFTPDGSVACFAGPAGGGGYSYWAISLAEAGNEDILPVMRDFTQHDSDTAVHVKELLLNKLNAVNKKGVCDFAITLILATDPAAIYTQASEQSVHVGPHFVAGDGDPLVLVGDAAHAMSPSYGQGANFAFEDAATLALCLKRVHDDGDRLPDALLRYSQLRVDRCVEMVRRSAERVAKQKKGEHTDDVFGWIFQWSPDGLD